MKRPTEEDREAWIDERYAELTEGMTEISINQECIYHDQATEDYNNIMADKAEQERDDAWYRGTLEGGE